MKIEANRVTQALTNTTSSRWKNNVMSELFSFMVMLIARYCFISLLQDISIGENDCINP